MPYARSHGSRTPALVGALAAVACAALLGVPWSAGADPGAAAVRCDVFADPPWGMGPPGMGMPMVIKQWAGTVIGHGADLGQAQADAERQKWGPYGMSPELRNCTPVTA